MKRVAFLLMILNGSVFSYNVLDDYYSGISLFCDSSLLESKILYPGLSKDSSSSASIGFLSHPIYISSSSGKTDSLLMSPHINLELSDLYGWTEVNTSAGRFGVWLGNLGGAETRNNQISSGYSEREIIGSTALWYIPKAISAFKGVSVSIDGQYLKNGSNRFYPYSSYSETSASESKSKDIYVRLLSMVQLSESNFLKIGLNGGYSSQNSSNISSNYYSYGSYSYHYNSETRNVSDSKSKSGDIILGFLNKKAGIFNLEFGADNREFNRSTGYNSYGTETQGSSYGGGLVLDFNYQKSKDFSYLKHKAYIGVDADLNMYYPVESKSPIQFSEIVQNVKTLNKNIYGSIRFPAVLEINLFNLPFYSVIRVTPIISGYDYQTETSREHYFTVNIQQIALGLKGKIGDRVEFALTPSLNSNIFLTGLDLKYNFKGK